MGSFREFLTKPRVDKQIGSFPLYVRLMGERRRTGGIQIVTAAVCSVLFVSGLERQLQATELRWDNVTAMTVAAVIVVVQQVYYTRKGQNYLQLLRAQYRADKERIAYLKEHHQG